MTQIAVGMHVDFLLEKPELDLPLPPNLTDLLGDVAADGGSYPALGSLLYTCSILIGPCDVLFSLRWITLYRI